MGITAIIIAAKTGPMRVTRSPGKNINARETGNLFLLVNKITENINSLYPYTNERTATVEIMGADMGSKILYRVLNILQPSMVAASSSSLLMPFM